MKVTLVHGRLTSHFPDQDQVGPVGPLAITKLLGEHYSHVPLPIGYLSDPSGFPEFPD